MKTMNKLAVQKRFSFGIGTIFSLIVVYFIFLYSRDKGWTLLALMSKWYLIIAGGLIALSFGAILLILLFSLLIILFAMLKMRAFGKKDKRKKSGDYIDIDYRIKE